MKAINVKQMPDVVGTYVLSVVKQSDGVVSTSDSKAKGGKSLNGLCSCLSTEGLNRNVQVKPNSKVDTQELQSYLCILSQSDCD